MPHDAPAALPLIAYIAGLTCGLSAREAVAILLIAILLAALKRVRLALIVVCAAAGMISARARPVAPIVAEDRFTVIEAPIDRDWMRRGDAFVLRVDHGGQPLAIYARFEPKAIAMEKTIRVEGFLRKNDREQWIITVKSPRLLRYEGSLSPLDPASWNRAMANRLRPLAARFPTEVALVFCPRYKCNNEACEPQSLCALVRQTVNDLKSLLRDRTRAPDMCVARG